jgi:hypothetical protein
MSASGAYNELGSCMVAPNAFVVTRDRPVAELVAQRLQEIPTGFGRLVYLARCVDHHGRYIHEGLRTTHDRASIDHALSDAHIRCFEEWLALALEAQHADVLSFLQGVSRRRTLHVWSQGESWRDLCPRTAETAQKELFASDLRVIVANLLRSPAADSGDGT